MRGSKRYNSVAISLHWLVALLLIGLLAMGKYMTHLEDSDPLRYTLTQWHKSFGISLLLLAVLRVVWRVTHKPPALPHTTTRFENIASHATHMAMYLLMVLIPLSGWVMVSTSPLNLETVLFGIVPWPHFPASAATPGNELLAERSALGHLWLANLLILLVLLHASAALFHQFVRRDGLISRMVVAESHRKSGDLNHGLIVGALLAVTASVFLVNFTGNHRVAAGVSASDTVSAGESGADAVSTSATVGFTVLQLGEPVVGEFDVVEATLRIDNNDPGLSTLTATVVTGSVATGDSQLDATVVTADWFDSDSYPEADFSSTAFARKEAGIYTVTGDLTIRGTTHSVVFELLLESGVGSGEFMIDRSDFGIGDEGQDEFVDQQVAIRFQVQSIE